METSLIVAIVLGSAAGLLVIIGLIICCVRRRKWKNVETNVRAQNLTTQDPTQPGKNQPIDMYGGSLTYGGSNGLDPRGLPSAAMTTTTLNDPTPAPVVQWVDPKELEAARRLYPSLDAHSLGGAVNDGKMVLNAGATIGRPIPSGSVTPAPVAGPSSAQVPGDEGKVVLLGPQSTANVHQPAQYESHTTFQAGVSTGSGNQPAMQPSTLPRPAAVAPVTGNRYPGGQIIESEFLASQGFTLASPSSSGTGGLHPLPGTSFQGGHSGTLPGYSTLPPALPTVRVPVGGGPMAGQYGVVQGSHYPAPY